MNADTTCTCPPGTLLGQPITPRRGCPVHSPRADYYEPAPGIAVVGRQNGKTAKAIAVAVEAARPVHYRAAADSLRAIAVHRLATASDALAHARAEGIKEAARLLERGLEDEGDTDGE